MSKLFAVDVSSMFFRAFYAIPPLTNKAGLPTNALYGFLTMSMKLLRESKSNYVVYCFDRPEPSFRADMYEDYKANRTEMPEELGVQLPFLRELTKVLGIPDIDKLKYEADDVIGTLVRMAEKNKMEAVIVSGDKDFAQLIGPSITMYDTMKEVSYDVAGVVEKWGVRPDQMIDYLAMVGDSSDNIPGVAGIGPKGAQKLLAEYGTLDGVYKNVDKISSKSLKEKLINGKESAYLSQELVTIKVDVDLGVQLKDLELKPIQKDELLRYLRQFEFTSLEKQLFSASGDFAIPSGVGGRRTKAPAKEKSTKQDEGLDSSFQLESPGSDKTPAPTKKSSKGKSLNEVTWEAKDFAKIEPYDEIWTFSDERGTYFVYKNELIQTTEPEKIGEILGPKFLQWRGFDVKEIWKKIRLTRAQAPAWDNMIAAYLISSKPVETFADAHEIVFAQVLPDLLAPKELYQLQRQMEDQLQDKLKELELEAVYKELELGLVPSLYNMEQKGIMLDLDELTTQRKGLAKDIDVLEKSIQKEAGEPFNVGSPKQLSQILFEKMKIKPLRKTKTGYSTDSDVLSKLAKEYPICQQVIDYRELSKLRSTYVEALPELVDANDKRLHTRFRQSVTATGRLSSVNPNLQNIPIRTERGRLVRKAFVAPKGHVLFSADYSQIELRVLAHIANDESLKKAFAEDVDIHSATAAEVFGVALDQVNPDLRRTAKAINFGIAYGQGSFGLSEALGISVSEATKIIEKYFQRFRGVKDYMIEVVEQAKINGYVETASGRRRYIPEIKSKNQNIQKFGERAAINAPIQGTASDLVKKAMIELYQKCPLQMLLQVHDEILFECPEDEVSQRAQEVKRIMENSHELSVPLKVNMAWGSNWEDAHS